MSRAFGPIIVLISTCLQVRSRPYCMGMHLASTKGGYLNFYRTCGLIFGVESVAWIQAIHATPKMRSVRAVEVEISTFCTRGSAQAAARSRVQTINILRSTARTRLIFCVTSISLHKRDRFHTKDEVHTCYRSRDIAVYAMSARRPQPPARTEDTRVRALA